MRATANVLEVLERLQAAPRVTGSELAEQLGVDGRTVRRYVAVLQELGIPVEGERGVGGGYRLRPGNRLPPLMLTSDEAVLVVSGLRSALHAGLGDAEVGRAALEKVQRVVPEPERARAESLASALAFLTPSASATGVAGTAVLAVAEAIRRARRLEFDYSDRAGRQTRRSVSAHGLVVHAGQWYLIAYDHGRGALRTFRADRATGARVSARGRARAAPAGFDAAEHLRRALALVPYTWLVEVRLKLGLAEAHSALRHHVADLEPDGEGTLVRLRVESLDWIAGVLAGLGCAFTVVQPDELRVALARLSARLSAA